MPTLTPTRQRGFEYLDEPGIDPATRCRSLRDVGRANALFGGTHAVLAELEPVLRGLGPRVTLLDVGSGLGDIPQRARASAARLGVRMETFGLDSATELGPIIRTRGSVALCGDARFLPFRDRSVDVVICSQTLHHFVGDEVLTLVR